MASPLITVWSLLALATAWTAYYAYCIYRNYQIARTIGVPIRIIPIDHLNKIWLLIDSRVVSLVKRLPGCLGDNNFTRYNYRGWHEHDGMRTHEELGEAFVLVTPSRNWLYLADPEALYNMYRRGNDFPRWVEITKMLDVFGGPNIATASGEQWKAHRRIVNSCLNEQCNAIVWTEATSLGDAMARYWDSKKVFTSVGEDARTVSLHVLTKACFGQSFEFEGHGERLTTTPSASFRFSLLTIMENALLILALGPRFFMNPWLPLPNTWKRLGEACAKFKGHMAYLYNQELRNLNEGHIRGEPTLMASLIRASQKKNDAGGLTEAEIYGTMFVVSFAGHDTTAHLLTYAMFFLAANPSVQDWLAEELRRVLGDKPREEWDYHADYPRLKRCLAILFETLRVKTPVAEVKWTKDQTQFLQVGGKTLTIPPKILMIPSYLYVHKHPKYWGADTEEWKPERWIQAPRRSPQDEMQQGQPKQEEVGESASYENEYEDDEVLLPPPARGNFLGWSEGARDCPAKKFSQVEWVALLAALFRDWKVEPQRLENETAAEAQTRAAEFIEKDSSYGGLLLQLMHPERVPLVWSRR
ncbi:cytochrome P450-like protein [Thozetella sp. PMI_491]|nr:cytochrome P450-like protein [Thozetella sp. PMI_491]